jgi:hypothetical protein
MIMTLPFLGICPKPLAIATSHTASTEVPCTYYHNCLQYETLFTTILTYVTKQNRHIQQEQFQSGHIYGRIIDEPLH